MRGISISTWCRRLTFAVCRCPNLARSRRHARFKVIGGAAEVYGVESLGATKGAVATFGVLATALRRLAFGFLLNAGTSYETLIRASLGLGLAAICAGWAVRGRLVPSSVSSPAVEDLPCPLR